MLSNVYRVFRALIPEDSLEVGEVLSSSGGSYLIELPGGGTIRARGVATVGQTVFVKGGVIEGPAPSLPIDVIEV